MHRRDASKSARRRVLDRLWPILLVVPLVAVPTTAILVLTAETKGTPLPIAQGGSGGFHPVAGSFEPDETRLDDCKGRYGCLEQAFGNVAYASGSRRAFALFETTVTRDPDVERNCHRIVHMIGSATLARNAGDLGRTFAQGSSVCASGYYHGILERSFVGIETKAGLQRVAKSLCAGLDTRPRSFLDYQCRHGLGHGFMIQTGYDLPTALSLCSGLGSGWSRVTCTSGAFMENVSTRFGFRSPWLDETRPFYPCNTVPLVHRRSCYVRASTWILQIEDNDFVRTAARCSAAPRKWVAMCFRGLGRDAVVGARYRAFARVRELCAPAGAYAGQCYLGAARTFGDGQGYPGVVLAARFCAGVDPAARSECVSGYGIIVGLVRPTREARRRTCAELAGRFSRSCSAAAEAEADPSGADAWG